MEATQALRVLPAGTLGPEQAGLLERFLVLDCTPAVQRWLDNALETADEALPARLCMTETRLEVGGTVRIFPCGEEDPAPGCWDGVQTPVCTLSRAQFAAVCRAHGTQPGKML